MVEETVTTAVAKAQCVVAVDRVGHRLKNGIEDLQPVAMEPVSAVLKETGATRSLGFLWLQEQQNSKQDDFFMVEPFRSPLCGDHSANEES